MTPPDRDDYVRYRLGKSKEAFETAELLVKNEKWNSAVNRLYYSAIYAISALLINAGINIKTHSGLKSEFFIHYIKTKKIDRELGKVYSDLFDWRLQSDYGDFLDFTEDDVNTIFLPTRELIERVKREIKKNK